MNKLRPKAIDLRGVNLSPEEGYILSRIDAPVSVRELVTLTGLEEPRLLQIVSRLAGCGAIEMDPQALPMRPTMGSSDVLEGRPTERPPSMTNELVETLDPADTLQVLASSVEGLLESHDLDGETSGSDTLPPTAPSPDELEELGAADEANELDELHEFADDGDALPSTRDLRAAEVARDEDDEDDAPLTEEPREELSAMDEAERVTIDQERSNEREYRKIYESVYRGMDRDLRMQAAKTVSGAHLMALCLDMEPQIIHAILTNPRMGLDQARFIALYHRTHIGLEILARRADFVSDVGVQRRLLRNPQLPDPILKKIVHPKLLSDVYKISVDREIPERSRVKTAELLRRKFMLAGAEERVALIIKTEGRVLILLVNCALDAHATQLLCGKTTWGLLLIRNLAHWSPTPPALLRHLLKQPVVRQNVHLRKMILKHPNTPSDVKRAFMV